MRHYVHFSREAITQIMMNGFESFVVQHKQQKRSGIEMFASLYGKIEATTTTQHHHIDFLSVDTSAAMKPGSVTPNSLAQFLKEEIATTMGYSHIGQMHSHPYLDFEMSLSDLRRVGCYFSDQDLKCFKQELSSRPTNSAMTQVVFAIRNQERQNHQCDGNLADNLFEFAAGRCKCFLLAQVFSLDINNNLVFEPTILKCEFLQSFEHMIIDIPPVKKMAGEEAKLTTHP